MADHKETFSNRDKGDKQDNRIQSRSSQFNKKISAHIRVNPRLKNLFHEDSIMDEIIQLEDGSLEVQFDKWVIKKATCP
jgi:hypothetical protein